MRIAIAVFVGLFVHGGCDYTREENLLTKGPAVDEVHTWFQQYTAAINSGQIDQWASFVADDAVILPPDEPPIIGMAAIRPRYEAVFGAYSFDFTGRPEEIAVAGHLAIVRATIEETLTPTAGGPPMQLRGGWLIVLQKQPDGAWKLWRNMWSVYPPGATQPPG